MPPPLGISPELQNWMYNVDETLRLFDRLMELDKIVKEVGKDRLRGTALF